MAYTNSTPLSRLRLRGGLSMRAATDLGIGFAATAVAVEMLRFGLDGPQGLRVSVGSLYAALAALVLLGWRQRTAGLGWANRVTLLRALPVLMIAGSAAFPAFAGAHRELLLGLGAAALALDGIDGWVARTTGSQSAFGARFDMELDAFFILALCVVVAALQRGGAWVLWIGLARYGFICGQHCVAWMRRPLPERWTRKLVCVWQVVTLLACLVPAVPATAARAALLLALTLLAASFARDVLWLYRRRARPA